jgi:polyhydroxyalkanoate synthase
MNERPEDGAKRLAGLARIFTRAKPPVGSTPADVVFTENKWRLLRYRAPASGRRWKTPVLLVPSLINRHYVLDLLPGKSFVESMVARGHDVFIVDWGTPEDEDRFVTFDDVADRYVGRAIRATCRAAGTEKAHVLGYCLGGTLTAIHAALRPEHVASLTALAAPIAFHDAGLLSTWTRTSSFDLRALVDAMGNVPWQLMQSAFHLLRPTMSLAKAVQLADKAWDDEFLDGFMAIETWGNDNVSFPGACYEKYVAELYRKDALVKGEFSVSGERIDLARITAPTLAITFEHDNIVPWQSAAVLLEKVGAKKKQHIHLAGGHVGAVVSKKAAASLWPQISAFWAAHGP